MIEHGVRVVSYGTKDESDLGEVHEAVFSDGKHKAVMRMLAHLVPKPAFECMMHEIAGALKGLIDRRDRRPQCGARIFAPGLAGPHMVVSVNRSTDPPRVWISTGPDSQTEVDWAACRYVDEVETS